MHSTTQVVYGEDPLPSVVYRAATLRVISGPDRGLTCPLRGERVRVGQSADNQLVLTDSRVSRLHAEVQVRDAGYLVKDLRSTNGTYFRGARVNEVLIGLGAEFRVGDSVLRVEPGVEMTQSVVARSTFGDLVGTSEPMQRLYGLLAAVCPSDVTVLIQGETGTGKELVAAELHRRSPRSRKPFVVVDCGAISAGVIESELFGHERGAFTGALTTREGAFERARDGVIFLDEVGELPLPLQTRLLRVLEARTVRRVGSSIDRQVDVRVVAATNRDLHKEAAAGRFRQDLYYRLAVVRVEVPPLRERTGDIPLLAKHFLWQMGCADLKTVLTPEVLEVLETRSWPGNVRELRNVIERAVLFADGGPPTMEPETGPALAPPPAVDEPSAAAKPTAPDPDQGDQTWDRGWLVSALPSGYLDRPYKLAKEILVEEFERLYVGRLFDRHGRNISRIAQDAEIDRHMVRKLLRKHRIDGDEE